MHPDDQGRRDEGAWPYHQRLGEVELLYPTKNEEAEELTCLLPNGGHRAEVVARIDQWQAEVVDHRQEGQQRHWQAEVVDHRQEDSKRHWQAEVVDHRQEGSKRQWWAGHPGDWADGNHQASPAAGYLGWNRPY